ncbi:hypothetical protein [Desulfosporosinus sp. FKA]|uniref:hypothetical protein n=1 Tax=Desulfosporosinus sp. FKA TaxID=1969834 RepID=UPI000B4A3EAF|nr:hypothetical protein [Desulfosporosinus sp. FKA]
MMQGISGMGSAGTMMSGANSMMGGSRSMMNGTSSTQRNNVISGSENLVTKQIPENDKNLGNIVDIRI